MSNNTQGSTIPPTVTREIAECFLKNHSFLRVSRWETIEPFTGREPIYEWLAADAGDYGEWWRVRFTDPVGKEMVLGHMSVLLGIEKCVYGPDPLWGVTDWMIRTDEMEVLGASTLGDAHVSSICQRTLFDGKEPYALGLNGTEQ